MKRFFAVSTLIAGMTLFPVYASSHTDKRYEIPLVKIQQEISDPNHHDNPLRHHRIPSRPLLCIISIEDGMDIPSFDKDNLLIFEIYDSAGICCGTFSSEDDFTEQLFSLSGFYEIRFITTDYIFKGYLEI